MANQTITTNTNFDALTGLLAGETVTINSGATLTIDSDPQLNRVLAGSITINDGLFFIDGTKVRELNFSGASVLPAIGDTLTAASVTGQVIGVTGNTTAGTIRLRSLNGVISNGAALSFTGGKTATAASADRIGWLNILGAETTLVSVPRLGEMRVRGQWHQLGVSNGAASQTFQHYSTAVIPCIWVETGSGTGIYEKYLNAGSRFPAEVGVGVRGKFFGMANGNATITFGNGTNGDIPPNGARIRVPNITIGSALTSAPTAPTVNATLGNWWELSVANGGKIDADICDFSAFYLNMNGGYEADLVRCGILGSIELNTMSSSSSFDDIGVGFAASIDTAPLNINTSSLAANNCDFARFSQAALNIADSDNCDFSNCIITGFNRAGAGPCVAINRSTNINFSNCFFIGGFYRFLASQGATIIDCGMSDRSGVGGPITTIPQYGFVIQTSTNVLINGIKNFSDNNLIPPFLGLIQVASNSSGIKIRNIGSPANPVDGQNFCAVFLDINAKNDNISLARIYFRNTRTRPLTLTNRSSNLEILNAVFDYVDPWETDALNFISKGIAAGNNAFGASAINASQGSVYGTIFGDYFFSATTGALVILGNESTASTANYYEITAGTPRFNGSGSLLMRSVGDQIVYTWPWIVLGHTGFANSAFTFSGTNQANHSFEYRLDTGSGFAGAWKTLSGANLSAEAISPTTGFRIQIRITCVTANANNAIAGILIPTTTTATDQLTLYPIGVSVPIKIFQCPVGSTVAIYRISDEVELFKGFANSQGEINTTYTYEDVDIPVRVAVRLAGYVPREEEVPITSSGLSLPMRLEVDLTDNL